MNTLVILMRNSRNFLDLVDVVTCRFQSASRIFKEFSNQKFDEFKNLSYGKGWGRYCLSSIFIYDTIITFHHHHRKLFKHLEMTYSQVWYIIRIVSSSPTHFHSEKIGLIRVTYDPPVSIWVNNYYSDLYSSVIHHWNLQLKPYWFPLRKNRVN